VTKQIKSESPLYYYHSKSSGPTGGVTVTEYLVEGHLIIRGQAGDQNLRNVFVAELGVELPLSPNTFSSSDDRAVYWRSPTEWLLILPADQLPKTRAALQDKLSGHIALVDVSSGQTRLELRGVGVDTILQKSGVYDFHADNFPIGKCVQTTFAHAGAMLSKKQANSVELIIRRSFSDYIAAWLLDAGAETGCEIKFK